MSRNQINEISKLLLSYSAGDYEVKGKISDQVNELDMIVAGINMLGEELLATNVSRDFFSSIFNAVTDLVFVINRDKEILDANEAVGKSLGYSSEEIFDHSISDFLDATKNGLTDWIIEELSYKDRLVFEERLSRKDRSCLIGQFSCSRILDRFGKFKGYLISIRDITEQKEKDKMVLKAIISTQQQEQKRVADILHDSLGQELSMAKLMISNMERYGQENEGLAKLLAVCEEILDGSVAHLREICFNLMPSVLVKGGIKTAVQELINRLESQDQIVTDCSCPEDFPRMDPELEIAVYRIVQEFINNMIKYAEASMFSIELSLINDDSFKLTMVDNGKGFDVQILERVRENRGYANIRSNVEAFNGAMDLKSSDKGTTLVIHFPKTKANEEK